MGTYLNKGIDFANGDQVTADKLDSLVESATFGSGAVDNSSTQLSGGAIIVKDGGITTSKIASGVTVSFADGSSSAPSITNSGDSDTGIYFSGDNQIGISVGGVDTARILQSSSYGCIELAGSIGAFIDMSAGSLNSPDYTVRIACNSGSSSIVNSSSIPFYIATNNTERLRVTGSGDVGIGTSSPATKLDVNGAITVSDGVRGGMKFGSYQAPTGVTSVEYTNVPSWAKRITLTFAYVSTNGTSYKQIQVGTSSGYVTSGYVGSMTEIAASGAASSIISTGLGMRSNAAADVLHGTAVFTNYSGNAWVGVCSFTYSNSAGGGMATTIIGLAGTLDRIRLTTVNGTDQFDDADINIIYEG